MNEEPLSQNRNDKGFFVAAIPMADIPTYQENEHIRFAEFAVSVEAFKKSFKDLNPLPITQSGPAL